MKVQFKQPRLLGSKRYERGVHEVPDAQAESWFFKALEKAGDIKVLGAEKPPASPAVEEKLEEPKAAEEVKAEEVKKHQPQSQNKKKS